MAAFDTIEVDEQKMVYVDRLKHEMAKWSYNNKEWAARTGIGYETLTNILSPKKSGAVSAQYLHAFWKAEPTIDLHYIITGERTAPKVFIRTEGQVEVIQQNPSPNP